MKERMRWYISLLRCLSFFFIVLSMLSSIGIIGFAMRFLVEFGYIGPVIGTNSPFYISSVTTLAGVVTFVMTPLGLFSMITFRRNMMLAYSIIMIFIISMCFYSAVVACKLKDEIQGGEMELWMATSLREEYGHPYGEQVDKAWDRLQQDLNCCGVKKANGTEWQSTMWYKSHTSHPRARVPVSCCSTCEDIHVKYCTSMSVELQEGVEAVQALFSSQSDKDKELLEERKICIKASEFCASAENIVANEGVCTGQALPPKGLPRSIFQHSQGCYALLSEQLISSMEAFCIVDSLFASAILLCVMSWTLLSLLTHDSYLSVPS